MATWEREVERTDEEQTREQGEVDEGQGVAKKSQTGEAGREEF